MRIFLILLIIVLSLFALSFVIEAIKAPSFRENKLGDLTPLDDGKKRNQSDVIPGS